MIICKKMMIRANKMRFSSNFILLQHFVKTTQMAFCVIRFAWYKKKSSPLQAALSVFFLLIYSSVFSASFSSLLLIWNFTSSVKSSVNF